MQIIDVSYGMNYKYGIEELWLNPNNYLMLANTIKSDLEELSSSKYAAEEMNAISPEALDALFAQMRYIKDRYGKWELVDIESSTGEIVKIILWQVHILYETAVVRSHFLLSQIAENI